MILTVDGLQLCQRSLPSTQPLAVLHDPGLVETSPDALEPTGVLRVGSTAAAAVLQHHGVVDQARSALVCVCVCVYVCV